MDTPCRQPLCFAFQSACWGRQNPARIFNMPTPYIRSFVCTSGIIRWFILMGPADCLLLWNHGAINICRLASCSDTKAPETCSHVINKRAACVLKKLDRRCMTYSPLSPIVVLLAPVHTVYLLLLFNPTGRVNIFLHVDSGKCNKTASTPWSHRPMMSMATDEDTRKQQRRNSSLTCVLFHHRTAMPLDYGKVDET